MQVISRVVKFNKYPRPGNIKRGNFCVMSEDLDAISPNDTIIVDVFNTHRELIASPVFTYDEFNHGLTSWTKEDYNGGTVSGFFLSFLKE